MTITFFIPGDPRPHLRHRDRAGGRGKYDPSAKDKEAFLYLAKKYAPKKPIKGPIEMILHFAMKRPKSHYGTGRNSWKLKLSASGSYVAKPDLGNLVKLVEDALNGVFYVDDAQIWSTDAMKAYRDEPGTMVIMRW